MPINSILHLLENCARIKTKKKRGNGMKKIFLIFLFNATLACLFSLNQLSFGINDFSETKIGDSLQLLDNANISIYDGNFNDKEDSVNSTNIDFFTFGLPLYNASETYLPSNTTYIYPAYGSSGTITVSDRPINEEKFGFFGEDLTGEEEQLIPVSSVTSGPNVVADSFAIFTIRKIHDLPDGCSYTSDTRKMKDLYSYFDFPGNTTQVTQGKILYRTKAIGSSFYTTDSWDGYYDLYDGLRFTFGGRIVVQFAIIYEIVEPGAWYQISKYYHVVGLYSFRIDA